MTGRHRVPPLLPPPPFFRSPFSTDFSPRRIVGWRVSRTAHADFVLDALEQALHDRRPLKGGLIHHSDSGGQYVAIRYTERLLEAGRSEERRVGKECRSRGSPDH